jgi:hypothetical protein
MLASQAGVYMKRNTDYRSNYKKRRAIPIFDVDKPLIQNIGSFVAASCPQSPLTTLLDNGAQAAIVYMRV